MKRGKGQGRARVTRALAFLLLISVLISTAACDRRPVAEKDGLEIKENTHVPVSGTSRASLTAEIERLAVRYLKRTLGVETLPEATVKEMATVSEALCDTVIGIGISDSQVVGIAEALSTYGAAAIDCVADIRLGTYNGSYEGVTEIYLALSELVGSDVIGEAIYEVLLYSYEYRYEKNMKRYETYGYEYLLMEANQLLLEKGILEDDVGADNFTVLMKLVLMAAELVSGGALDEGRMAGFSNEELLLFIQHVKVSDISLGGAGWELILTLLAPDTAPSADAAFSQHLLFVMGEAGDLGRLAASVAVIMPILSTAQMSLTAEDVSAMREGRGGDALVAALSRLSEDEWQRLDGALGADFDKDALYSAAYSYYGEDFATYAAGVTVYTLDELLAVLNTETFYEGLEGYIAGISPALSYWYTYDKG